MDKVKTVARRDEKRLRSWDCVHLILEILQYIHNSWDVLCMYGHHWSRCWLGACLAPSHYLNQRRLLINRTTQAQISIKKILEIMNFHWRNCTWKISSIILPPFCPGAEELTITNSAYLWSQVVPKTNGSSGNAQVVLQLGICLYFFNATPVPFISISTQCIAIITISINCLENSLWVLSVVIFNRDVARECATPPGNLLTSPGKFAKNFYSNFKHPTNSLANWNCIVATVYAPNHQV